MTTGAGLKGLGLLIVTGLLLAGCGQNNGPEPNPTVVSGKVRNWQGSGGVLEAQAYDDSGPRLLASAPIDSQGTFNLTLPEAVSPSLLMNVGSGLQGCGDITVSSPNAGVLLVSAFEAFRDEAPVGAVFQASTGNFGSGPPDRGTVMAARLYSDRAVSIRGTCSQQDYLEVAFTFDLTLSSGWNTVFAEVTESTTTSLTVSIRSGRVPATVDWYIAHAPVGPVPPPVSAPSIGYVSADPGDVDDLTVTFHWEVYGSPGSTFTCTLDPGDGSPAYVIADCESTTSQDHIYSEPGEYMASFWVENEGGEGEGWEFGVMVGLYE